MRSAELATLLWFGAAAGAFVSPGVQARPAVRGALAPQMTADPGRRAVLQQAATAAGALAAAVTAYRCR